MDFFNVESLGVHCTPRCGNCRCGNCPLGGKDYSLKEEREMKMIEDGLKFIPEEGCWEAQYPWTRNPNNLPDNRRAALATLKSTERRLKRDPERAAIYHAQMTDMVDRGVARKVTDEEAESCFFIRVWVTDHGLRISSRLLHQPPRGDERVQHDSLSHCLQLISSLHGLHVE